MQITRSAIQTLITSVKQLFEPSLAEKRNQELSAEFAELISQERDPASLGPLAHAMYLLGLNIGNADGRTFLNLWAHQEQETSTLARLYLANTRSYLGRLTQLRKKLSNMHEHDTVSNGDYVAWHESLVACIRAVSIDQEPFHIL